MKKDMASSRITQKRLSGTQKRLNKGMQQLKTTLGRCTVMDMVFRRITKKRLNGT